VVETESVIDSSDVRRVVWLKSLWLIVSVLMALASRAAADGPAVTTATSPWQQLSPTLTFTLAMERERYTTLDRSARMVFFAEAGKDGPGLESLAVNWSVRCDGRTILERQDKLGAGLLCVDVGLASLPPGRYDVAAQLMNGAQKLAEQSSFFRVEQVEAPAQQGRIALVLPAGMPLSDDTFPVHTGVPFPKGALWDTRNLRLVDAQGQAVPCGFTVRSRWGSGEASIRWLGVDFQPSASPAWWPQRERPQYFLEFGPQVSQHPAPLRVTATDQAQGITVDTGAMTFLVRRKGFNLIDEVTINGRSLLVSSPTQGLYLVDHKGTTYRAANDTQVKLTIEEQTDLRVVVRAEGWYVKDGATGRRQSATLPTDQLCRFITRIEAYAGKSYVRVLSTWINTYDTFSVRLRDLGLSLPMTGVTQATFGIDDASPHAAAVSDSGVRLVQHLHDQFVIEDGQEQTLATGTRSAGWVIAQGAIAALAISNRETWQRFPKELEVLPDSVRLHVWPAHGKDHPDINPYAKDQIHRLWFAHQGRELNLAMPWDYFFAVSEYAPIDNYGKPEPHAFEGVQSYAIGTAITTDLLLHFVDRDQFQTLAPTAQCFQAAPHALADPQWSCDSLALGYIHPYDPDNFRGFEETISDGMRGYRDTQDAGRMFGMWIHRSWNHNTYNGDGSWGHYRLFNGTHHGEAIMPWVFYARSGDPFHLQFGRGNIRQLADVQIVHHADLDYEKSIGVNPSQGKLVGATKHDNCIAPWGADHEVFGHQTCYNGLILAHYLTGDLRLREVLVDEWQSTITTGRHLPAIQSPFGDCASAQAQGRDNANPVSDLIDLYQLTYDPATLAVLKPRLDMFLYGPGNGTPSNLYTAWGHALHNVILFHGMEDVRRSLLTLAGSNASAQGDSSSPARPVWDVVDQYRPNEAYAMAAILDPSSIHAAQWIHGYAKERAVTQSLARIEPQILAAIPDYLRPIPRMMYALMHSTRRDLVGVLGDAQPMPTTWSGKPLQCIIREDVDQDIAVHIAGVVHQADGLDVQAFDPDGKLINRVTVPSGQHLAYRISLPRDHKTGQYVVLVERPKGQSDDLSLPLTTLPEVYLVREWVTYFSREDLRPAQFFTRSPGDEPRQIAITGERTRVFAADKRTPLAFTNKQKKDDAFLVGPQGAWICGYAAPATNHHTDDNSPAILAIGPERWFMPSAAARATEQLQ
jgi:hypothetical protein